MPAHELAPLALAQLSAWRSYASRWYWRLERRQTDETHRVPNAEQYHLVCAPCEQSITVVSSEGIGYLFTTERLLDEVTRHLRNIHRGVEVEVYGQENGTPSIDTRGHRPTNGANPYPGGLQVESRPY